MTRIYEALEYIGKRLFQLHPDVSIDYTFELWGEKSLIDPALLTVADLDWLSNVEDKDASTGGILAARTLLYGRGSDGIIVLFKNASAADSVEVQLTAPPNARYQARSIITGATLGRVTAADLKKGWTVRFSSSHPTEIIELSRR